MKIVLTIWRLFPNEKRVVYGGAQKVLINIANYYSSLGHDVFIITHQDVISSYKTIVDISEKVKVIIVYPENVRNNKLENLILLLDRYFPSFRFRISFYKSIIDGYYNRINTIKPNIVVSFLSGPFTFLDYKGMLKKNNVKYIIAYRDDPRVAMINPYNKYFLKKSLHHCFRIFIQVREFIKFFPITVHEKVRIIPNSLESKPFHYSDNKSNIILSVGRLYRQKNHSLIIESFSRIASKHPDWMLYIVGSGPANEKSKLIDICKKTNLGNRIQLYDESNEIEQYYKESKIFALASFHEGFSNALLEAMSFGLPSIVIDQCISNSDIVSNGKFGIVSSNDKLTFANDLDFLIRNENERLAFEKNAFEYVKNFKSDKIYKLWLEYLDN